MINDLVGGSSNGFQDGFGNGLVCQKSQSNNTENSTGDS
jgi:hypothetical protein